MLLHTLHNERVFKHANGRLSLNLLTFGFFFTYLFFNSNWMSQETKEFLREGYCHTGDKGYYDVEGNVFIVGRYKELLKYSMAHVSCLTFQSI